MAFYAEAFGPDLRFGDVVTGCIATAPRLDFKSAQAAAGMGWDIRVRHAKYFAVLSPCCNIERGCILVAPLQTVRPSFLENPYLLEDLTRINAPVPPDKALPPKAWRGMSPEEQARRASQGAALIFHDCFVYERHKLLEEYVLDTRSGKQRMAHYLLDIAMALRVESDSIDRNKPAPGGCKLLELSIPTRGQLRDKVAAYFGRVPDEDRVVLAA